MSVDQELKNLLSVEEIIKNGVDWNYEWIRTAGSDHWLSYCWEKLHNRSNLFVETSCEITAEVIRHKSGFDCKWSLIEDQKFSEIRSQFPIFQISIGEDWMDCEHILTIWQTHIIQSYYAKYTIHSTIITDEVIAAIDQINNSGNYEIVTRNTKYPYGICPLSKTNNFKVYYWVPKAKD